MPNKTEKQCQLDINVMIIQRKKNSEPEQKKKIMLKEDGAFQHCAEKLTIYTAGYWRR